MSSLRSYVLVTIAYWAFTLSDGALRMLVLLHFYQLGYSPVELAFLFLFYEFFGVVTNLFGGWLASRRGLRATLLDGLGLQIVALVMLSLLDATWSRALSVAYVMAAQALSGIAKDLTKMSAKSAIKVLVPENAESALFKWVAILTGSKNALKGVGFFLGGLLLVVLGFKPALWAMAAVLLVTLIVSFAFLPGAMGKAKAKTRFSQLFSKKRDINVLSGARFFLFGARDIWFVVGVPVFLTAQFGWGFTQVGGFEAAWVIGYGMIQAVAPPIIGLFTGGRTPRGRAAQILAFLLAAVMAAVAVGVSSGLPAEVVVVGGLAVFGVIFALSSSVHSYLVLAYSEGDTVALNVGFYYMANAGGRLVGTLMSGLMYQATGVAGCLWLSAVFAALSGVTSLGLPSGGPGGRLAEVHVEGAE
jgi:predicted MFS family arabinose efflux permease